MNTALDRRVSAMPRRCIALWTAATAVQVLAPLSSALTPLGFLLEVAALVVLCRCPWWSIGTRLRAVLLLVLPTMILNALAHDFGGGLAVAVPVAAVELACRAAVLVWLWRTRTAPAPGDIRPLPRWARIALVCALSLVVLSVLAAAADGLWIEHNLNGTVSAVDG